MTIAIIIARGGSRRLPRKNLKLFCGHPLMSWAIIQALCSKHIDKVYVSTDDDEIEMVSKSYGAKVIRRPDWPDADQVAANRPFRHAIEELKKEYGDKFNEVLTILPTTPLNLPSDFDRAIELYRKYGVERLSPLIPRREAVLYRKRSESKARFDIFDKDYNYLGEGGGWVVTSPEFYMTYTSEISDIDVVLNDMDNWTIRETGYCTQEYWQYADVDTEEEFEFAELVMDHFILKGNGDKVYWDYFNSHYKNDNAQEFGGD